VSDFKIYALADNFLRVRYVGLTSKSIKHRFKQHMRDFRNNTHKANWVKKYGNSIMAFVIEDGIKTAEEAKEREIYYIKTLKDIGCNLINATEGGDYSPNKGKVAKNKGVYRVSMDLINKLKEEYATGMYSQKDLAIKHNISKSSIDRYLKIENN
jgi:hypothetical protein